MVPVIFPRNSPEINKNAFEVGSLQGIYRGTDQRTKGADSFSADFFFNCRRDMHSIAFPAKQATQLIPCGIRFNYGHFNVGLRAISQLQTPFNPGLPMRLLGLYLAL